MDLGNKIRAGMFSPLFWKRDFAGDFPIFEGSPTGVNSRIPGAPIAQRLQVGRIERAGVGAKD
jgi:hypothetical protein